MRPGRKTNGGVALLEVVLALALFFAVAVGVMGGLSASVRSVRQVRLEAEAADLAVTLLSEMQLGLVPLADSNPTPYDEPLQDWTWQVTVSPVEMIVPGLDLARVEIIIRNTAEDYTYRLYQVMAAGGEEAAAPAELAATGVMP